MNLLVLTLGISISGTFLSHPTAGTELLLYGGSGNNTFLGCLSCYRSDSRSICNKAGEFGSPHQPKSIWNTNGIYGSKYQPYSPWKEFTTEAPVIVDAQGNFYGYFTASTSAYQPTRISQYVDILKAGKGSDDLESLSNRFCSQ